LGSAIFFPSKRSNNSVSPSVGFFEIKDERATVRLGDIVRRPESNAESCRALRHSPFLGFSLCPSLFDHGRMWLALKREECEIPVIQQRFS